MPGWGTVRWRKSSRKCSACAYHGRRAHREYRRTRGVSHTYWPVAADLDAEGVRSGRCVIRPCPLGAGISGGCDDHCICARPPTTLMRGDRSVEWPGGGLPVVRWRQACTLARPAASLPRACRVGPTDMHARCGGQCMPCMGINRRDRDGMGVRQRIRGACTESTVRRRRASPRTTTKGMRRSVGRPGSSIYHDA
jgi:hypothetical protein